MNSFGTRVVLQGEKHEGWVSSISRYHLSCSDIRANSGHAQRRAQVHSKQVKGAVTLGEIPYLLAHSSGDVHLPDRGIVDKIMPPDAASVLENMTCDGVSDVVVLGKLGKGISSPTVDQGISTPTGILLSNRCLRMGLRLLYCRDRPS